MLLVFHGSDWCAPCIKLQKKIWQSEQFKTYSKESLVIVKLDFPRKKANQLADFQKRSTIIKWLKNSIPTDISLWWLF